MKSDLENVDSILERMNRELERQHPDFFERSQALLISVCTLLFILCVIFLFPILNWLFPPSIAINRDGFSATIAYTFPVNLWKAFFPDRGITASGSYAFKNSMPMSIVICVGKDGRCDQSATCFAPQQLCNQLVLRPGEQQLIHFGNDQNYWLTVTTRGDSMTFKNENWEVNIPPSTSGRGGGG